MTFDQFTKIIEVCGGDPNKIHNSDIFNELNKIQNKLANDLQFAHFINQVAFETQVFTKFVESLYYTTPDRLVAVWPSLFKSKYNPDEYVKSPEKLANLVYANKLGNGGIDSGDGWKYIGRGGFHLTGRANYTQCSHDLYNDNRLVNKPQLVETVRFAFETALWFWNKNNVGNVCQINSASKVTKKITGCLLTEAQRNKQYLKIKEILL